MEKISFEELCDIFYKHNEESGVTSQFDDKNAIEGVVVFKESNWKTKYSETSRSYLVQSDNKYFLPAMAGNSIFASCLDGTDESLRLDYYLDRWEIEYCYIKE